VPTWHRVRFNIDCFCFCGDGEPFTCEVHRPAVPACSACLQLSLCTSSMIGANGIECCRWLKSIGMDTHWKQVPSASVGFGGSCFQKDILNLVYITEQLGLQKGV